MGDSPPASCSLSLSRAGTAHRHFVCAITYCSPRLNQPPHKRRPDSAMHLITIALIYPACVAPHRLWFILPLATLFSCVFNALICNLAHDQCSRTRFHGAMDVPSRLLASCVCCSRYTALSRWVKMLASAMHAFVGHTWEWPQLRFAKKHDTRSHSVHITARQLNLGHRTSVQRRAP